MSAAALALAAAGQLSFNVLAAAPAVTSAVNPHGSAITCSVTLDGVAASCNPQPGGSSLVSLPRGSSLCPGSGPGAACLGTDTAADATPGVATLPAGETACPRGGASGLPATPAACSNVMLGSGAAPSSPAHGLPSVLPSVPAASLLPPGTPSRIALQVDATTLRPGQSAVLIATATNAVMPGTAIEIFDLTSGALAGACAQTSQCMIAYAARGGTHTFSAYVTGPTTTIPAPESSLSSNAVSVAWLASSIAANNTVVGPGYGISLTATSTIDVGKAGRWLEIYDLTTKTRLTYCSRGTTCTTTLAEPTGGKHEIVGYVTGSPEAVSTPIYVTWLSITLAASTTTSSIGAVYLRASTNADITTTPWVLAIYDDHGRLVDHACKTGHVCAVQTWVTGKTPYYTAEIGALPAAVKPTPLSRLLDDIVPSGLTDVQARSAAVKPTRMLWGVDSCKAFTDNWWGTSGLLPTITYQFGKPDFWGRYLTDTVCPGISADEIHAAAYYGIGILPIYNDYNCSDVVGYSTGHGYGDAAVQAAESLGIPKDRALAIDIEPAGADCPGAAGVDSGFIEGWYDAVYGGGYVPAYYGNGTGGSDFASAWCDTVAALPNIARDAYLWSFEPSLVDNYNKASAPGYYPYGPSCAGTVAAWQYQIGSYSPNPNIDSDLAMSAMPIWYPGQS